MNELHPIDLLSRHLRVDELPEAEIREETCFVTGRRGPCLPREYAISKEYTDMRFCSAPLSSAPISFSQEYKDLMSLRVEFPEAFKMAKRKTGLNPDSVENCVALLSATKESTAEITGERSESALIDLLCVAQH